MKIINEITNFAVDSILERLARSRFKTIALVAISEIGYRHGKNGYPREDQGVSVPTYGWVEAPVQPVLVEQRIDLTPPVARPEGKIIRLLDWRRWRNRS